jgi:mRNA-degrading endonuclease toxin of MazEF toxin-antitoxin module
VNAGEAVTLTVDNAVGGEKQGSRPAIVLRDFGPAILVAPLTDAEKRKLPTHHLIRNYSSGTQTKDALITCEHAISVHPSRLSSRPGAEPMAQADLDGIRTAFRIALALAPVPKSPPSQPALRRGFFVQVDFDQVSRLSRSASCGL